MMFGDGKPGKFDNQSIFGLLYKLYLMVGVCQVSLEIFFFGRTETLL